MWWVDKIGELLMRMFEECCIRWICEKEYKWLFDDDKIKIEYFLWYFFGWDILIIMVDQVNEVVLKMVNCKYI